MTARAHADSITVTGSVGRARERLVLLACLPIRPFGEQAIESERSIARWSGQTVWLIKMASVQLLHWTTVAADVTATRDSSDINQPQASQIGHMFRPGCGVFPVAECTI
jgi:hypothetical protein